MHQHLHLRTITIWCGSFSHTYVGVNNGCVCVCVCLCAQEPPKKLVRVSLIASGQPPFQKEGGGGGCVHRPRTVGPLGIHTPLQAKNPQHSQCLSLLPLPWGPLHGTVYS